MTPSAAQWIWQHPQWPAFVWHDAALQPLLRVAYDQLGQLKGRMAGQEQHEAFTLDALLTNIVASSAIESEHINVYAVRSSLARKLGIHDSQPVPTSAKSEGLASLVGDAVTAWQQPLTMATLLQWHQWLFASHDTLLQKIIPGTLRGNDVMQVVSGPLVRPKVHFEAPPRHQLEAELERFIAWFNASTDSQLDPLLRAGITHLWLVTLHPFEDGNGRIARALTDRALAQADQQGIRLFAMSEAILTHRKSYYQALERSQRQGVDITDWLVWFIEILIVAIKDALSKVERTLFKTNFWAKHGDKALLETQRRVLNRLLDGEFEHGISASQYCAAAKVSKATATRHLAELVALAVLEKLPGGGRNTRYVVAC
jgi:Fic family protein